MNTRKYPSVTETIVTTFDAKPIPIRRFDWTATFEGYEPGDPIGYGETEEQAINDLKEQA